MYKLKAEVSTWCLSPRDLALVVSSPDTIPHILCRAEPNDPCPQHAVLRLECPCLPCWSAEFHAFKGQLKRPLATKLFLIHQNIITHLTSVCHYYSHRVLPHCWGEQALACMGLPYRPSVPLKTAIRHVYTAVFKTHNQQGPTIQHRELCPVSCNNLNGKKIRKRIDTRIDITESLLCTLQTNTTLLNNYTPVKHKVK